MSDKKVAIIIGGGPAGLTAAYELGTRTDIHPIVLEMSDHVGGISATIEYKGNKIDLGGHRFFSKSDRIMDWWIKMMPIQKSVGDQQISYQSKIHVVSAKDGPDPEIEDRVLLLRERSSRIYFLRKFFDYPLSLHLRTLIQLGPFRLVKIGVSYIRSALFPIRPEKTLEDFFINRFGRELYNTFFKSYTEKVWGRPCQALSAEWGAQRVKGLSVRKAVEQAVKDIFGREKSVGQKNIETSLIEQFLYPKYGPGQMWEIVQEEIKAIGGEVRLNERVVSLDVEKNIIRGVHTISSNGSEQYYLADYLFSSMPITELFSSFGNALQDGAEKIVEGLAYRDFMVVGLLLDHFTESGEPISDNWMYIQESDVEVGRIQIFNNWSSYLVADSATAWIGMEYFCNATDDLWNMEDEKIVDFASQELKKLQLGEHPKILDGTVIRVPKAYPVYADGYDRFDEVKKVLDTFVNLYCIGRNGMHKYNNQDHSMLTAMMAVDSIISGDVDREKIWSVNTEQNYHEEK